MKKVIAGAVTILLTILSFIGLSFSTVVPASADAPVPFCHALGGAKYLYKDTVSKTGIISGHVGDSHQNGEDIIPAFTYETVVNGVRTEIRFPGQNLEKLYLIDKGCKEDAEKVAVVPSGPKYVPGTCSDLTAPYGKLVIPAELGTGVESAVDNGLSGDNSIWTATYSLKTNTDGTVYEWKAPRTDGLFTFSTIHISSDPLYVVNADGVGECKIADTGLFGLSDEMTYIGGGLLALGVAFVVGNAMIRRRNA